MTIGHGLRTLGEMRILIQFEKFGKDADKKYQRYKWTVKPGEIRRDDGWEFDPSSLYTLLLKDEKPPSHTLPAEEVNARDKKIKR